MGAADDFLRSLLESHPEVKTGNLTEDQLGKLMSAHQHKVNNSGLEEFDGLSPEQMHLLLNAPFSPASLLSIKAECEKYLDKVPLLKLSELLISEIGTCKILKLTAKGNLPIRICEMLYSQDLIHWNFMKYIKRFTEDEIPYVWPLKQYLIDMKVIKMRNNTLSLTREGEKFMQLPVSARFQSLLSYFLTYFHWGNFYDLTMVESAVNWAGLILYCLCQGTGQSRLVVSFIARNGCVHLEKDFLMFHPNR